MAPKPHQNSWQQTTIQCSNKTPTRISTPSVSSNSIHSPTHNIHRTPYFPNPLPKNTFIDDTKIIFSNPSSYGENLFPYPWPLFFPKSKTWPAFKIRGLCVFIFQGLRSSKNSSRNKNPRFFLMKEKKRGD